MKDQCGIILLAAGSSSRLGSPKQSLQYNQVTLLEHSIDIALASIADDVIIVLGANADAIRPVITDAKLDIIINDAWQEGMASSIRCGLQYLLDKNPTVQTALFMVCDQPYVNATLLNNLVTLQQQKRNNIVASEYGGTNGIPAVFDKQIFPALLQLKGDAGAKKIIMQQQNNVATVPFPLGSVDIDTAADYEKLQKMKDNMQTKIILFGQLTEIAGLNSIVLDNVSDTNELMEAIKKLYPAMASINYIIAVDKKAVQINTSLNEKSSVALLPPFSGG